MHSVGVGALLVGALACSPHQSAHRDSGVADRGAATIESRQPRAPLARTYALVTLHQLGPYVKGGRNSPVRVTTNVLAETLSFTDSSADSGKVNRRQVDRVSEFNGGRVTLERIDATARTGFFRRIGDTIVLITPGRNFSYLHSFAMRAAGDTLETVGQTCLPTPCLGSTAMRVWRYGRVGPPWWGRYVESPDGRIILEARPGAPKVREVVIHPRGAALGGPRYPTRARVVVDAAPGVSRAVRWLSSDTSIVRVVPTSDSTAMICPQPRAGETTITATSLADPRVRGVSRVGVLWLAERPRSAADSLGPPGACRQP